MSVYILGNDPSFPPVEKSTKEGIVAIGGDLSSERLLNAYQNGIFPWYSEEGPILWWSPDPRLILFPDEVHISRSMRRLLNQNVFRISFDRNFLEVIKNCRQQRVDQEGTWINEDMIMAYHKLHRMGYAHSIEVWKNEILVGGMYGVSLGACFFAESMFYTVSNASKFGFIKFAQILNHLKFNLLDCQVTSPHLQSLGAREISRDRFLSLLKASLMKDTITGNWSFMETK
jgi:leucyl/phenylalanyl-tRNA--protein transferase